MAYTEFYCQNGGSNLNAGSTTNNTAAFTSTNGNWNTSTNTFTPTDGSTPASFVSVGDWVSIYIDGATVGVFIARVTTVTGGSNGPIVVSSTARCGTAPTTNATARSLKAGGAWQGPNGASPFPFGMTNFGNNTDSSIHRVRVNMKNDQIYSITSVLSLTGAANTPKIVQGYTSSPGDGGKATWDGSTSSAGIITALGSTLYWFIDHIFTTSFTTGTTSLVVADLQSIWIRCVFQHARQAGIFLSGSNCICIECEAYDCCKSNTAALAAFYCNGGTLIRCIAHDNAGSNTSGFLSTTGPFLMSQCISDTNGQYGISVTGLSVGGPEIINQCDIYNNTSDGINIILNHVNSIYIENTNLIKNGGKGINNASITTVGYTFNLGYGAGTQANGSADTLDAIIQSGNITYASNVTPWTDPANGDFRISLAAAKNAGRGAFTETASSYAGAIGYPDIGAVQALAGSGGETSYSFG